MSIFDDMFGESRNPTAQGLLLMLVAGIIILLATLSSVCAVLAIVGYIFALMGFLKIYRDRFSYPEPHPSNMRMSFLLYLIGLLITIACIFAIAAMAFWMVGAIMTGGSISDAFDKFITNMFAIIAVMIIGSLCIIIARYKLLVGLMPPNRKGLLKMTMVVLVIVTLIGMVSGYILFNSLIGSVKDSSESTDNTAALKNLTEFQTKSSILSLINEAVSVLSELLFVLCFYFAYDYQKNNPQLRTGIQGMQYTLPPSTLPPTTPPPGTPPTSPLGIPPPQ